MRSLYPFRPMKHPADGFTLIEVMLVLAIIAILSSITMPSLRGFAVSTRLKSSAHAIRDLLYFARDMAITEKTAYLVVFDLDGNRYWLSSSETFDPEDAAASSITSASNSTFQTNNPQRTNETSTQTEQTGLSRTSMILGVPQEPIHNVSLTRMTTNHNLQPNQVNSGVDYIYFSPSGSSEETVLYIQDRGGKEMAVTVESATGRVHLQEIDSQQGEASGMATSGGWTGQQ